MRARATLLASILGLGLSAAAAAQSPHALQLRVARGPHYAGVPVEIHVQSTDFEREPAPDCLSGPTPPGGGDFRLVGIVPNFSSSMQIINGRVTRSETTTYTCQWLFVPTRPGLYEIGPFEMAQGSTRGVSAKHRLRVTTIPEDPRIKVKLILPDDPVYVGQHLPLRIEWWLDATMQQSIRSYTLRGELFERDDAFRFIDDQQPGRGEQTLNIETQGGEYILKADVREERSGARRYLVVSAERILVPLKAGEYALAPATIDVTEVTQWQRDLFGGKRPAATRKVFAKDEERTLVIEAPPLAGRPASFAGAVGRGFDLEVSADRSVVQLGDPIKLTLTVRGGGNLENVALPDLSRVPGLGPDLFRFQADDVSGQIEGEAKTFELSVRVLDDAVREIPAIEYSWFDPELGSYQTARSRPIALSVRPAQVISAGDVVAPKPQKPEEVPREGAEDAREADEARGRVRGRFSLTGADLSLEERTEVLLARRSTPDVAIALGYGFGIASVGVAFVLRRRGQIPDEVVHQRAVYKKQSSRAHSALGKPAREAASEVALALREIAVALPEARGAELDSLLQACDALLYAPATSGDGTLDAALQERVRDELARMRELLP